MKWWKRITQIAPEVFDALGRMAERGASLVELRRELAKRIERGDLDPVIKRAVSRAQRVRLFQKTGLDIR